MKKILNIIFLKFIKTNSDSHRQKILIILFISDNFVEVFLQIFQCRHPVRGTLVAAYKCSAIEL